MEKLYAEIVFLRDKMHKIALKKGVSHPDVLRVSQNLDIILNQYNAARMGLRIPTNK